MPMLNVMTPFKSLGPVASWLLRTTLLIIVYQKYFDAIIAFEFDTVSFYISVMMGLSAMLLLVGGITKNSTMTVLNGLFISMLSVIVLIMNGISIDEIMRQIVLISVGLYFFANGNK